ncbi:MAG: hypothetical protein N4A68_04900 [Maledivibacter sp.]|nr:hypothetical protein [Maledivibacter sp.]
MSCIFQIAIYISALILFMFLVSLVKFYFYRKRQIDKLKIVEFIVDTENTASAYNIHKSIFYNKDIGYVTDSLYELEGEHIIKQIRIGHTNNNNGLWEHIKE